MSLSGEDEKELLDTPPFDQNGKFSSEESYKIFRHFFNHKGGAFTYEEVAAATGISEDIARVLCHQYHAADMIDTKPGSPGFFYKRDTKNWEMQAKVESSLMPSLSWVIKTGHKEDNSPGLPPIPRK